MTRSVRMHVIECVSIALLFVAGALLYRAEFRRIDMRPAPAQVMSVELSGPSPEFAEVWRKAVEER